MLAHDLGEKWVQWFFSRVQEPGVLHPQGGQSGFDRAEFLLGAVAVGAVVLILALLAWRGRGVPLRQWADIASAWGLWAIAVYLVWLYYILFAAELAHFVQYGLIGVLTVAALGWACQPHKAVLVLYGLGMVDEVWQHFALRRWLNNDPHHWMDWSDPVLNGLGACGGILLCVSWALLKGQAVRPGFHLVKTAFIAAGLVLLPLLLMDEVRIARFFGSYIYYPFWHEVANNKPVHWPNLYEGVPLNLAALLVMGLMLDPRRYRLGVQVLGILAGLMALATHPPQRGGQPIHEVVPFMQVPRAAGPGQQAAIVIDGVLDEPVWAGAGRTGALVNNLDGQPWAPARANGDKRPSGLYKTEVFVLWDSKALYLGFKVEDEDIWARPADRDEIDWYRDELLEVLIDEGGDEITYYRFSLTPLNVQYDALAFIPEAPVDYNAFNRHQGFKQWDARHWQTSVRVDGTVETVKRWNSEPAIDRDRGYTVEMAIPWANFASDNVPGGATIRRTVQPQADERWRFAVFRTERPRVWADQLAGPALRIDTAQAADLLGVEVGDVQRLVKSGAFDAEAKDGLLPLAQVQWKKAEAQRQLQAWAPVYNAFLPLPSRFGVIEFVADQALLPAGH